MVRDSSDARAESWQLLVSVAAVVVLAACSNGNETASDLSGESTGIVTVGPESPHDPMLDLAHSKQGTSIVGQRPLLSRKGNNTGRFTLPAPKRGTNAIVTVSCVGAGRFHVEGDGQLILDSPCAGFAAANILLPWTDIGTIITVRAPGPFWVVVVPTL